MDWSLALVSQGIETTINFSEDTGWSLIVPAEDHERARQVIRLYRTENLHWPWRTRISQHDYLFDWSALAWVFIISVFFWLQVSDPNLRDAGIMRSDGVAEGEWWRIFTAMFLHGNLAHLAGNASIGFILIGLAMGAYGTGVGLFAVLLAGAGGNVLRLIFDDGNSSLGASGMVMGALGLLVAQSASQRAVKKTGVETSTKIREFSPFLSNSNNSALSYTRRSKGRNFIFSSVAAGVMLFVLIGTSPDSDVLVHFGGFISGIILGILLHFRSQLSQNRTANVFSAALFCMVVILAWWRALNAAS